MKKLIAIISLTFSLIFSFTKFAEVEYINPIYYADSARLKVQNNTDKVFNIEIYDSDNNVLVLKCNVDKKESFMIYLPGGKYFNIIVYYSYGTKVYNNFYMKRAGRYNFIRK